MQHDMVEYIDVTVDSVTVNKTSYPINEHVFVCNGVEMEPSNITGWFHAAREKSKVFINLDSLRNATIELVQE